MCGEKWKTCSCPIADDGTPNPQRRLLQPMRTIRPQSPARHFSAAPGPSTRLEGQDQLAGPVSHPVAKPRLFDLLAREAREQEWYNDELKRLTASTSRLHLALPEASSTGQLVTEEGSAIVSSHGTGTPSAKPVLGEQRASQAVSDDPGSDNTGAISLDARDEDNDSHHSDVSEGPSPDMVDAINRLRDNDDCSHDQWRLIRGPYRCDECDRVLTSYIFECKQCLLQACSGCRENMLEGV